ncbi:MAG: hypothetical protein GXO76_11685 [Calditrichaeota bacterium]|nr:hypothetical protein [Calditrichota bacterium]
MKHLFHSFIGLLLIFIFSVQTSAKPKYAMAVYHFNLQYVAGDQRIERRIVRESIKPLLNFYDRHPNYKGDFEIQAWALEVIQEEFPEVLEHLRRLIKKGQLELVVAHYSDQFFIGYPAIDMQRSVEMSDAVLKRLNLKRSRVFIAQEIQYSPAIASALHGKYDVVVTSSNPYGYYRSGEMPLEEFNYAGKKMLILLGGGKKNLKCCKWDWAFFDDGEVFSTRDYASDFYRVPSWEKKHIDKFKRMEKEGYTFVTVSEFVKILKEKNYKIPKMAYIPEGTWNMGAGGPYNWLGKQGSGNEKDGLTRARNFIARGWVLVAETLSKWAEKLGANNALIRSVLRLSWKHLLLGEVSDSSGWSPLPIEVRYTDEQCAIAEQGAGVLIKEVLHAAKMNDQTVWVDLKTGTVAPEKAVPPAVPVSVDYSPVPVEVRAESYTIAVQKFGDNLYKLEINARRPVDGMVKIAFPLTGKLHYYSAPMGEDSLVAVPPDLNHNPILSLSNGLFTLGNGWNLIKDNYVEHLAGMWDYKTHRLVFREGVRKDLPGTKMAFYLYKAPPQKALQMANGLNVWPIYRVKIENGTVLLNRVMPEERLNQD